MPFFEFHQNNSGGAFKPPAINVIIEADNANEANEKALWHGIYFDGCAYGLDCSCCGDRWYPQWDDDGTEAPSHYSTPVDQYVREFRDPDNDKWMGIAWGSEAVPDFLIIRKDGSQEKIVLVR